MRLSHKKTTKTLTILLLTFLTVCLVSQVTKADITTPYQLVNLNVVTGQSLVYQDAANNRYVNWTVLSGTLTGTANLTVSSTGGSFAVTSSSSCTVNMSGINAYILVGSIYQTTYTYNYVSGTPQTVTWIFTLPPPAPTPTPTPQYYLFLGVTGSGTTDPTHGIYRLYSEGATVNITAYPAIGWAFDYWLLGDGTQYTNQTITLTMTHDETAMAVFSEIPIEGEPTPAPTPVPTPIPTPPIFPNSIDSNYLWQFLWNGDIIGFFIAMWTHDLGETFWVIISLIVTLALYIRLKNLPIMIAMWFVLGFVWIGLFPLVSPFVMLFFALGICSLLVYIFMVSKY